MSQRVEIVCVNAGDKFPDYYVERLYNMLCRKFSRPFRLTCFTDRGRDVNDDIVQVDIAPFSAKGPFNKVLLYNPDVMPYDEALFMDITLVIKEELSGYVDYAKSLDKDLVAIRDWRRPVMNSCFQWITKNDTLRAVWDVYDSDKYPEFRTKGDQFFTYSTLQALGLEHEIGYFPDGEIQSYKVLREAHRESDAKFQELWAKTKVIKFHGMPRQHDIVSPWLQFWNVAVRHPQYVLKDWNFLKKEIEAWWR
jgi:hypothetical protein